MKSLVVLFLFITVAQAKDSTVNSFDESTFLQSLIAGQYNLIGKSLNSQNTYLGEVSISDGESESELQITRVINGKITIGKAKIEQTMEKTHVLRIHFTENEINYEQTCLIGSDLDNYARLTCHLYEPEKHTKNPGLEALFIKQE
jgi:hypothetical protein